MNLNGKVKMEKDVREHCCPIVCTLFSAVWQTSLSNGLKFENIYVWSKSLHPDKCEFLSNVVENVEGVHYCTYSEHAYGWNPRMQNHSRLFSTTWRRRSRTRWEHIFAWVVIETLAAFISVQRIAVYQNIWCATMLTSWWFFVKSK